MEIELTSELSASVCKLFCRGICCVLLKSEVTQESVNNKLAPSYHQPEAGDIKMQTQESEEPPIRHQSVQPSSGPDGSSSGWAPTSLLGS